MLKTPFFSRMLELCHSMKWKEWAGYHAVSSYLVPHDLEYFAFRHSSGLLDITPLFKYRVKGKEAAKYLSSVMVKDISRLKLGQVSYVCWCTDDGKVVDDGTVMRLAEDEFFVTSADPCYSWFSRFTRGFDVSLEDVSDQIAGLALQGPTSREILKNACDAPLDSLRFFRAVKSRIRNFDIWISRTGYTGDLGYELWVENKHAIDLWDEIISAGSRFALRPAGLDALDMCRVEAGLILKNVDYFNALHVLIDDRKSTPYELGLGWIVDLEREPFNGQKALALEKKSGSTWSLIGLDIDWSETEALYARFGLPPEVGGSAWRKSIPIYDHENPGRQVGYATSGTWSPTLKKNIALATVRSNYSDPGLAVQFEMTVEHRRYKVTAIVHQPQFFNPERKRSIPSAKTKKFEGV